MKIVVAIAMACISTAALADNTPADQRPVVPEVSGYIDIPGAALKPDPTLAYKVVFEARRGGAKPFELAPAIELAASELNTFVAAHVKNFKIAMVFHSLAADDTLLDNAHFRAKYGVDNPNLPVLAKMREAGVEIYVCGEQLMSDGVDFKSITRDATIANDGLIALIYFENKGYALITF